jgi:CPA2 family monovalent cation:H+ antiporter-2
MRTLIDMRKNFLVGGSLQVTITILITFIFFILLGITPGKAIFAGFLISLSSTAIALRIIQEKSEVSTLHGRTALSILVFQDIIVVAMILFTPLLGGNTGFSLNYLLLLAGKGIFVFALIFVCAKFVVPWLLREVSRTKNRELFMFSIFTIAFSIAWLTSSIGLSLALGAFLAGLVISESDFSYQAFGNILSFRDIFACFFFISIGMLLKTHFLLDNFLTIILLALGIILLKTIAAGATALFLGLPVRNAIITGLLLSQIGEFSFILARVGMNYKLINDFYYQIFLNVTIITMVLTPLLIKAAPQLGNLLSRLPIPKWMIRGYVDLSLFNAHRKLQDHLIIIGMGLNGQNVARAAKRANIPYIIIDGNSDKVKKYKRAGELIFYGDAYHEPILKHANLESAKVVVIGISDAIATLRITEKIRRLNASICIVVRTRYVRDIKELYKLGANEVIPEEFETSVEIFSRVLTKYEIPPDVIARLRAEARADGYELFYNLDT